MLSDFKICINVSASSFSPNFKMSSLYGVLPINGREMELIALGNMVTVDLYISVINREAITETTNAIMLTMINGFLHLNIKTNKFWLLRKSVDFCEFN
ncbi:MAG: hypothetical protein VR77_10550 [Flavobacteriales bacterium BRH_c54]|nr:MAG: hypothetical protein VR77_10550 [Flavobacteriales bacterium BRH_c54]